jgi:hypothetical protein
MLARLGLIMAILDAAAGIFIWLSQKIICDPARINLPGRMLSIEKAFLSIQ